MPEWAGMRSVTITDSANGVGLKCVCDFGRFTAKEEVVEWVEGRKITHQIEAMGMSMKETWLLDPIPEGTKFRWRQEVDVRGAKRLFSFLMKRQLGKAFDGGMARLRAQVEASPA
jgi:hypothetical protein